MRAFATICFALTALATPALADGEHPSGQLVAGGEAIGWEDLVRRATAARVVYVGEEHGTPSHHLLQRDLLAALDAAGPVLLGCEYFPRSLQPALDRIARGEVAREDLGAALRWDETWGHAWEAYAPLFELCAERRIRIVALNAEKDLVQRVRRQGLAKLSLDELLGLPRMDLKAEAHRARVTRQLQEVHPLPDEALERYYQAFTLWDETMAASVVDAVLRDGRPGVRVLVVAGIAHIQTGTGIPDRVARRLPAPRLIVACGGGVEPSDGDVLFVSAPRRPEGHPPAPTPPTPPTPSTPPAPPAPAPDGPRWY